MLRGGEADLSIKHKKWSIFLIYAIASQADERFHNDSGMVLVYACLAKHQITHNRQLEWSFGRNGSKFEAHRDGSTTQVVLSDGESYLGGSGRDPSQDQQSILVATPG